MSTEFYRPEYWSLQPFPSPGDLPNPGVEPRSPALRVDSSPAEPQEKPLISTREHFMLSSHGPAEERGQREEGICPRPCFELEAKLGPENGSLLLSLFPPPLHCSPTPQIFHLSHKVLRTQRALCRERVQEEAKPRLSPRTLLSIGHHSHTRPINPVSRPAVE